MKIFVDSNILYSRELFGRHGDIQFFEGRNLKPGDIEDADALLVRSVTLVGKELLAHSKVQFVGSASIGTDHVDRDYLQRNSVSFAHAPGCNSNAVGDYVISALLSLHHREKLNLRESTLGVIGFGNVGKNLTNKARALGLKVYVNDPPLYQATRGNIFSSLDEVLKKSDILTFHVPLTTGGFCPTAGMINSDIIDKSSRAPLIINTSRGEIVREIDMLRALDQGSIRGVVLDVFKNEPRINGELCKKAELISPHIAGYSLEGKLLGSIMVYQAFCRHFNLKDPGNYPELPKVNQNIGEAEDSLSEIYQLIKKIFYLEKIDEQMRDVLDHPNFPHLFDAMRKNFYPRRDFSSYKVKEVHGNPELVSMVQGLGFKYD